MARITVERDGDGFMAWVPPSEVCRREIRVPSPIPPLKLMEYLCSFGYEKHEVAVAILDADPDAFEGDIGLD